MAEQNRDRITRTLLQAEIMALLHDVGKLHWRFVDGATQAGGDLQVKHTVDFWNDADNSIHELLHWPLPTEWLPAIVQSRPKCLGELLLTHHYTGAKKDTFLKDYFDNVGTDLLPKFLLLIMYADTADSLFAKGNAGNKENTQTSHIHLAHPQGGAQYSCERADVEQDAHALAQALNAWFEPESAATWDIATLKEKRRELMDILRKYGSRHMAETRLPNNDVTLWQHSYSVASIFKALLADCLHKDSWEHLLSESKNLVHAQQELSMLAVRWDAQEWVGKSLRSFEVVGRELALQEMTNSVKEYLEEELAWGNEIYRDHTGICFLVPPAILEAHKEAFAQRMDEIVNRKPMGGDLAWHTHSHATGLRLTGLLDFWHDNDLQIMAQGPSSPQWMHAWDKAGNTKKPKQVCPRCGLRPIDAGISRTGSSGDTACDTCRALAEKGFKVLQGAAHGKAAQLKSLFGIEQISHVDNFFEYVEWEQESVAQHERVWGSRLALVQGFFNMHAVQNGTLCDLLLSTPKEKGKETTWSETLKKVQEHWEACCQGKGNNRDFFNKFFGESRFFATASDGWCSLAPATSNENEFVQAYIDTLIFGGERQKADTSSNTKPSTKSDAEKILTWALRQHPAPSRMARLWDEARTFMQSPFALAQSDTRSVPFVPLHCDISSFQMLVPAKEALRFMEDIAESYAQRFGQVRHMLPLHLSASVFYYKSPMYIAMDAARRFRGIMDNTPKLWTLTAKTPSKDGQSVRLEWLDHAHNHAHNHTGRTASWTVSTTLPDDRQDTFRGWFRDAEGTPVHISHMQEGAQYHVMPSTFDFEVLDASTRRYDIFYDDTRLHRPHFMMPHDCQHGTPRPYLLETLDAWKRHEYFFTGNGDEGNRQRHVALELLAKLHATWQRERQGKVFEQQARSILVTTLGKEALELLPATLDGSFFDLCEWHDFINK